MGASTGMSKRFASAVPILLGGKMQIWLDFGVCKGVFGSGVFLYEIIISIG